MKECDKKQLFTITLMVILGMIVSLFLVRYQVNKEIEVINKKFDDNRYYMALGYCNEHSNTPDLHQKCEDISKAGKVSHEEYSKLIFSTLPK